MTSPAETRRGFLRRSAALGAGLGAGAAFGASPAQHVAAAGASGNSSPAFDLAGLPMRQDDRRWARDLMWDRRRVIRAARAGGMSHREARSLLWDYPDGNSIGNEGCQLTCMAMVLHLLAAPHRPAWTPKTLNRAAHEGLFYTLSGLAMNTLYADLVSEVTDGAVQLAIG
ncbi:MAG: twin-arginine translocation signal domain-containing protein, partial [Solirubrobacterales bacterium]